MKAFLRRHHSSPPQGATVPPRKARPAPSSRAEKAEGAVTTARNAKGFIAPAQRILIDDLGSTPNKAWEDAGWPSGTIAAPPTIDGRKKLLDILVPWLTTNPEKEVANKVQAVNAAGKSAMSAPVEVKLG